MTDFLKLIGSKAWPELDAYLEAMVIMMTCDGNNDPRELELFTIIGEELHRYHLPAFSAVDLKLRWDTFSERLKTVSAEKRLYAIADALPSRASRMMALFFALKISSADMRVVPAERDMLHKMRTIFELDDTEYNTVTVAYRSSQHTM